MKFCMKIDIILENKYPKFGEDLYMCIGKACVLQISKTYGWILKRRKREEQEDEEERKEDDE